ncbi:hypothetical protein [Vibrio phage vB_VviC_ZQ26]|nr:hypothetical protein [Vibrio phage vB_VviC_ZQ26]
MENKSKFGNFVISYTAKNAVIRKGKKDTESRFFIVKEDSQCKR